MGVSQISCATVWGQSTYLVVGDMWNRMHTAACHCTKSLLISFSTTNSVLFFFFFFYLCPLRHHTFILEDILSKNLQPKPSSESLPTNPCTPRSHRSSTDAPWLLILQKSSRDRRFLEALPQIILEDTCAPSWASVKGLGNTDLCFCLNKSKFQRYKISKIKHLILGWAFQVCPDIRVFEAFAYSLEMNVPLQTFSVLIHLYKIDKSFSFTCVSFTLPWVGDYILWFLFWHTIWYMWCPT